MEIVYATSCRPWMSGKTWRNARFFTGSEAGITRVFIDGSYPAIVEAYEKCGATVFKVGQGGMPRAPEPLAAP